jgi:hypothetical protein
LGDKDDKSAHSVGGRDDEYLQNGVVDGIKALDVILGIVGFLMQPFSKSPNH